MVTSAQLERLAQASARQRRRVSHWLTRMVRSAQIGEFVVHVHGVVWHDALPAVGRVSPHRHAYYEALLVLAGEAVETCGGRQHLGPGTLQVHPPQTLHGWQATGDRLLRLGVTFSLSPAVPLRHPQGRWPTSPEAVEAAWALLAEASCGRGSPARLQGRFLLFLDHVLALLHLPGVAADAAQAPAGRPLPEIVEDFLRCNLSSPLTLADVALVLHTSPQTLRRRYLAATGGAVMQRFFALRMAEAQRLLRETELSVQEIGRRVGFTAAGYFCRRFRTAHGESPRAYARRHAVRAATRP